MSEQRDMIMDGICEAERQLQEVRRMLLTDGRPADLNLKTFEIFVNVCHGELNWISGWCAEECIK